MKRIFEDHTSGRGDGRNIRPDRGTLSGEGAAQEVSRFEEEFRAPGLSRAPPIDATSRASRPTYHGRNVVKAPVWIAAIPIYFWVGGVAGASATLAAAAQIGGGARLYPLVKQLRWVSTASSAIGGGLLIHDLGRPARFFNMLRVFRPTSPMSVGSWLLTGMSGAVGAAAVTSLLAVKPKALHRMEAVAGISAGLLALPFTGYTAVLIANTAIPVWQSARQSLPLLFIGASMASLASLMHFAPLDGRAFAVVERFGIAGRLAELASGKYVERQVEQVAEVGRALREGRPGLLWTAGKVLSIASLAASLLPRRFVKARNLGAAAGIAATFSTKLAVFLAGAPSAKNPHATFDMQRQEQGAAQVGRGSTNLVQLKADGRVVDLTARSGEALKAP